MDINLPIIVIVAIAVIVLLVFLIRRNKKDRKEMVDIMNQDYNKPKESESENDLKT